LSAQAAAQTRTYRARLKPVSPRPLPLGATATLVADSAATDAQTAILPAAAITQHQGQPAVWAARPQAGSSTATVELVGVAVHGYRNDAVLVSGPAAGTLIVAAGVQKMAPGLRVALPAAAQTLAVSPDAP
jgi:membrane fusion protein, multidrug efflux system